MRAMLRFFGFLFTAGTIVFLVSVTAIAGMLWHYSRDLPDYSQLQDYEPAVMTRVHAADGSLLAEYAHERRLYLPIQAIPKLVINAFVAAEDKNFYEHNGIDFQGVTRAGLYMIQNYGSGRRPQGASTITQQVAKNFLLTNELKFSRKIREALLAMKIERTFSKQKILELYLNEIYLGVGAYGVAAASLLYFDKSVHELTIPEAAYLAALPKGPNNYNPFRKHDEAVARRNYVIERMAEDHYITAQEAEDAKKAPLKVTTRPTGARIFAAEYFAEEVRRYVADNYGERKLYEGGLSVRTTLDPKLQLAARKALIDGLVRFDENTGYHGAVTKLDLGGGAEWGAKLADVRALSDVAPWRLAVVLDTGDQVAHVGFQPGRDPAGIVLKDRETGVVPLEAVKWAKSPGVKNVTKVSQVLSPGDVVYVEPLAGKDGQWRLRQVPEISGAIMAMEPLTGRVLAMVGGFSYDQSQFNRASQALRQPGSSFKPIVYSAALDNGYTPSSIVLDAPLEVDTGSGIWRPENYEQNFYGPSTLRFGIEHSRNVMTVRLAQDIGMPMIAEYAKRFGVYDNLPPYLSFSLGAGETTLMRMVGAYAMIDNGGRKVQPTLIDRIQDRYGKTIYKHDQRECRGCDAPKWANQSEPTLLDRRDRVIDPMTAYQITEIMTGVVKRGTAAGSGIKDLGKPIAGKTGTTNDEKDVWFIGFSPDLVVGVFMGYDKPRHIADRATGGALAAPIFRDFMKVALADKPPVDFRVPVGIKLITVDSKTGMRTSPGDPHAILEAFKPGTAPPDAYAMSGVTDPDGRPLTVSPEADRAVNRGGLY